MFIEQLAMLVTIGSRSHFIRIEQENRLERLWLTIEVKVTCNKNSLRFMMSLQMMSIATFGLDSVGMHSEPRVELDWLRVSFCDTMPRVHWLAFNGDHVKIT